MSYFSTRVQLVLCVLVFSATTAFSGEASAGKVPFVYNTGDDIFVAGDGSLPAPYDKAPKLAGAQAGYKCEIFGFFYAYFTISDCKPVAFKGNSFFDSPALAAAIQKAHPESTMKVGIWKKHGRIPLGLVALALVGLAIWGQISGDDDDDESMGQPQVPPQGPPQGPQA